MTLTCPECGATLLLSLIAIEGGLSPPEPNAQERATHAQPTGVGTGLRKSADMVLGSKNFNPKPPATRQNHPNPEGFSLFWSVYPLRKDRRRSAQAWRKVVAQGADVAQIIAAAKAYRDDPNRVDGYTKYPATWLNAGAWMDEDPLPPRLAHGIIPAPREQSREDMEAEIAALGAEVEL